MLLWMWKVIKLGSKLACLIHVLRIIYILRYIFYLLHISLVIQQRFLWTTAIVRKAEATCLYFLPVVDLCYQKEKKKILDWKNYFLIKSNEWNLIKVRKLQGCKFLNFTENVCLFLKSHKFQFQH